MNKLDLKSRTMDNEMVKNGLFAVSNLSNYPISRGLWMVVGGMAVQGYLPSYARRPTADIDLSVVRPLNYAEFRDFAKPVMDVLKEIGYSVETKKTNGAYILYVADNEGKDIFAIEFARRNSGCFERAKNRLERELENSRKKLIDGKDVNYVVSSPEDIVVPKLVRGVGTLKRNPGFEDRLLAVLSGTITDEYIRKVLDQILYSKAEASVMQDPVLSEKVRLIADGYDARLLSKLTGFNQKYLEKVIDDWDAVREPSKEKDILFELVFH